MADCEEQVYSNEYFDFIVSYEELLYAPVAAVITAGACAQVMQWALVDQNNVPMTNADLKNNDKRK